PPPSAAQVPAPPAGSPVRRRRTAASPARPGSGRAQAVVARCGATPRVRARYRRLPPSSTPTPPVRAPSGPERLPRHQGHDRPTVGTTVPRTQPSPGHSYNAGGWLGRCRTPSYAAHSGHSELCRLTEKALDALLPLLPDEHDWLPNAFGWPKSA